MKKTSWLIGPNKLKVLVTLIVLSMPILKEHVRLAEGGFVVVRYIPLTLAPIYLYMGDYYPLLLMLGFYLFVYLGVSLMIEVLKRVVRKIKPGLVQRIGSQGRVKGR